MKNVCFTALLLTMTLTACSKKETNTVPAPESNVMLEEPKTSTGTATPEAATSETAAAAATPETEGKTLVEGADCLSCHKVDAKLVGPSYQEVAAKYTEADVDKLAEKIIDGGKGNWGEIPMTAHAGMSKENAQKMVKYILSLKK